MLVDGIGDGRAGARLDDRRIDAAADIALDQRGALRKQPRGVREQPRQVGDEPDVEQDLGEGKADRDPPHPEEIAASDIAHPRDLHRPPQRERQHVHVVGELRQRLEELAHA